MINTSHLKELEKKALDCLHEVIDPEIGLNIVDLGLIYAVSLKQEARIIQVKMTLTTQFCPMGGSIIQSVEETLNEYFPDYQTDVDLIFEPPWDASMISEEGEAFLDS